MTLSNILISWAVKDTLGDNLGVVNDCYFYGLGLLVATCNELEQYHN